MKRKVSALLLVFAMIVLTCVKVKEAMMVSTGEINSISQKSAEASGTIVDLGGGVTEHGHCWGTAANVSTNNSKTTLGKPVGAGGFTSPLSGLVAGTKYYIKAYISNGKETVYGKETSFTTLAALLPVITTTAASDITQQGAISGGNISSDGGADITARGVCWNTATGPTTANNKTSDGTGTGAFTSSMTSLSLSTTYYVRAYATNSTGTAYGNEIYFTTAASAVIPPVTTTAITGITKNSASSGGTITNDGGAPVTDRGVCWSLSANPTVTDFKTSDGTGIGIFNSSLTGLDPGKMYYVRAFATNIIGTGYGNQVTFFSSPDLAVLTTTAATSVAGTSAVSGGNISSDGGAAISVRGVCWKTSANPTVSDSKTENGGGTGVFTSNISGLLPSTKYYYRAYATNSSGTAYGNELSFTTSASMATVSTLSVDGVTSTTATGHGSITSDGGSPVTARGVCWSTSSSPALSDFFTTNGSGTGSFSGSLTNLSSNTRYYVRAYATNSAGTEYGNEVNFTTSPGFPTVITTSVTMVTGISCVSGGDVTNDGGGSVTARGVCWGSSQNPTIFDSHTTDGSGSGSYSSTISALLPNSTYYLRAYATNSSGTSYGNQLMFTSGPNSTANIYTTLGQNKVTVNWNSVISAGSYTVYWSTSHGVSRTNFTGKIMGLTGTSYNHTGLTPGMTYYYVVTANNANGESIESTEVIGIPPLLFQTNTFSATGQKQYYQVTVSSGQNLLVNVNRSYSGNKMYLYVKQGSLPTELSFDAKSETGDDEGICITNTVAGTYYIMVLANYYAAFGDYTIFGSTSEPTVSFGTFASYVLDVTGEKQYFEVTMNAGENLFVNISRAYPSNKFFLYVKYNSLPTALDNDAKSETGADEAVSITNTQAGKYYIMVFANYYAAFGNYNISIFK